MPAFTAPTAVCYSCLLLSNMLIFGALAGDLHQQDVGWFPSWNQHLTAAGVVVASSLRLFVVLITTGCLISMHVVMVNVS